MKYGLVLFTLLIVGCSWFGATDSTTDQVIKENGTTQVTFWRSVESDGFQMVNIRVASLFDSALVIYHPKRSDSVWAQLNPEQLSVPTPYGPSHANSFKRYTDVQKKSGMAEFIFRLDRNLKTVDNVIQFGQQFPNEQSMISRGEYSLNRANLLFKVSPVGQNFTRFFIPFRPIPSWSVGRDEPALMTQVFKNEYGSGVIEIVLHPEKEPQLIFHRKK